MTSQQTTFNTLEVDGVNVFYRSAGSPSAPVILLLHGFPTNSFQFRNLIPLLAKRYRVIAPDFPGFGFTQVPEERKYDYTFDNLATTIQAFVDKLEIKKFAVYVFDYGGPVGFRLASQRPSQISAIISQNGNAYVEGFGEVFWAPFKKYWALPSFDPSLSGPEAEALKALLPLAPTQWQYEHGVPAENISKIDPATYQLDAALMQRPGNYQVQLSLFYDYGKNVPLYPGWHEHFRTQRPRLLAMWGKNDTIFVKEGAAAFKRDLPDAEIVLLDAGHFPLETNLEEYATKIDEFLSRSTCAFSIHRPCSTQLTSVSAGFFEDSPTILCSRHLQLPAFIARK